MLNFTTDPKKLKQEGKVARGMKEQGYEYIIIVPIHEPLYSKTISNVCDLLKEELKDYRVTICPIDWFLNIVENS